jgi:ABC-type branched-subunit amino acid transport system ATPase component/MFS family permease
MATRTRGATPEDHLLEIRAQEAAVEEVAATARRLRAEGRRAVGVTGDADVRSLRETLGSAGVGMYPAVALGLLVAVDQVSTQAMTILGPEISGAMGIPRGSYAMVLLLKMLVVSIVALPIAALVQNRARRAAICVLTAFVWSALTAMTGFTISVWGLGLLALAAGAATGSTRSLHEPLLLDTYPPESRVRVVSFYRAFDRLGDIAGPLIVAGSTILLGLTWRGVFVTMGLVSLLAALAAVRLRDPGFGRWDTDQVRRAVRTDADVDDDERTEVGLGFFEVTRRVLLVPTVRRMMTAWAVMGMMLAPLLTYWAFFLQERWGMGPGARSLLNAAVPVVGIAALQVFGRRGESLFRRDPAQLLRLAAGLMGLGVTAFALGAVVPVFAGMVVLFCTGMAAVTVMGAAMSMPMYAVVPANMRAHLGALQGIFVFGVGGVAGVLLLSGIDSRFGTAGAILSISIPGVVGGFVLRGASRSVNDDLDRMLDRIVEEEEVSALVRRGTRLPMLACRNIDFSYGQLQVLFGVDFTVDEGEMVALLGTNGAGKSTLLRVVSGLGLPSGGSVRFGGSDITFVDPDRRVRLGISQVPGGKAVFGSMRVIDNLRVLGYTHGRDRKAVEAGIEASFDAFPRLAERRNQLASTLSGGEQQMLGLATAFVLRPRLLLIDELSLGLAPIIVGELLDMVRRINATGTSIVLVEQSVNVALSLVDHAYFMEKGEVRYDGVASELLARPDLLRSVFLEGASKGLDGSGEPGVV